MRKAVLMLAASVYVLLAAFPVRAYASDIPDAAAEAEPVTDAGVDEKKIYNDGYGVYLGVDDLSKLKKLSKITI